MNGKKFRINLNKNHFFKAGLSAGFFLLKLTFSSPEISAGPVTFNKIDLYSKAAFSSGLNSNGENIGENFSGSKILFTQGCKLHFNYFNLKFTLSQKEMAFKLFPQSFIPQEDFPYLPYFEKLNFSWGAESMLNLKSLPVGISMAAGSLCTGASFSRMKSPGLTFASSLNRTIFLQPGLSPHLSGLSSTAGEGGLSICLSPRKKELLFLPDLQAVYFFNGDFLSSVFKNISLSSGSQYSLSLTAALLNEKKEPSSSGYYLKQKPFRQEKLLFVESEANLLFPGFKMNFAGGLNQSPFGGAGYYVKSQQAFSAGPLFLKTGFFWGSHGLLCPGSRILTKELQFAINPQVKVKAGLSNLEAGFLYQRDFSWDQESREFFNTTDNFRGDLNLTGKKFSLNARAGCKLFNSADFRDFSAGLSFSKKAKGLQSSSTILFNWDQDQFSLNLTQKFTFQQTKLLPPLPKLQDMNLPEGSIVSYERRPEKIQPLKSITFQSKLVFKDFSPSSENLSLNFVFQRDKKNIRFSGYLSFKVNINLEGNP